MAQTRPLQDCPVTLLIVYTVGADADARGYEPWLRDVDNPFFNAIAGVGNYSNWKVEAQLSGGPLPYTHFDFQGLDSEADLEPVWFNKALDGFRKEWIRLWGYGAATPHPVVANAYLLRPDGEPKARLDGLTSHALVLAGVGAPPETMAADLRWTVDEVIRKHFAVGAGDGWRASARPTNPLGLDWLAVRFGNDPVELAASYAPGEAPVAFVARCIASPKSGPSPRI